MEAGETSGNGTREPFGPYLEKWVWPWGTVQYAFYCPGCKCTHVYQTVVGPNDSNRHVWTFNNNPDSPTFEPSLVYTSTARTHKEVCHLFLRNGHLQFLTDCTHELAGQTVKLQEYK